MEQLRLFAESAEQNELWAFDSETMFTALLLQCGPPPVLDGVADVVPLRNWFLQVRRALEQYLRPDYAALPANVTLAINLRTDRFLNWIALQRDTVVSLDPS